MNHVADPERYDGTMRYRRTGRSGLDLPVLSLGYWHNFGDDRPFEVQRAISRQSRKPPSALITQLFDRIHKYI